MTPAPHNLEMERQCLGAMMVSADRCRGVILEVGLRPEHFYLDRHQAICQAIYTVLDRDDPTSGPDELLVNAELREVGAEVEPNYVSELCATVAAPGNLLHHAAAVLEEAEWRQRHSAIATLTKAVAERDRAKLVEVESALSEDLVHATADFSPGALQEMGRRLLTHGGAEAFAWPIKRLNDFTAGGIRRGEFVLIGGHSSHGKSMWLDQCLTSWAKTRSVHLYMNEMAVEERVARMLSKRSGVRYSTIIAGKAGGDERDRIERVIGEAIPYGITSCAGWSAPEIAHHIRRNRYDIAAIDILHLIEHTEERDLAAISATFARAARQADCAIIATVHLNEKRVQTAVRPRPTLGDIRGSGSLKNDADTVCFVYRKQDEQGVPLADGEIYLAKVRNGVVGAVEVRLMPESLSFERPMHVPGVPA